MGRQTLSLIGFVSMQFIPFYNGDSSCLGSGGTCTLVIPLFAGDFGLGLVHLFKVVHPVQGFS